MPCGCAAGRRSPRSDGSFGKGLRSEKAKASEAVANGPRRGAVVSRRVPRLNGAPPLNGVSPKVAKEPKPQPAAPAAQQSGGLLRTSWSVFSDL